MKIVTQLRLVLACAALTASVPVFAQAQQSPDSANAPAATDTPAQTEAIERMKARAEQRTEEARKAHNEMVAPSYNFHYGPKNPYLPGNVNVEGTGFQQPGAYPSAARRAA